MAIKTNWLVLVLGAAVSLAAISGCPMMQDPDSALPIGLELVAEGLKDGGVFTVSFVRFAVDLVFRRHGRRRFF